MNEPVRTMTYAERLAQFEKEKMLIDKTTDSKTYEDKIKAIAKKWKI